MNFSRLMFATLLAMPMAAIGTPGAAQDYHNGHSDVYKLDIYGARLGMTANEVLAALHAKFGPKAKINITRSQAVYSHKKMVDNISIVQGDYKLAVSFTESSPDAKAQPEQVWKVSLRSQPYRFTGDKAVEQQDQVEQEFIDDVLAKYPTPDGAHVCTLQGCGNLKNGNPVWCARPTGSTYSPCPDFEPWMKEGPYYDEYGRGTGFELELENQRATQDAEYYYRTHQADQHLSSSPFK